jgi:hypothetical protein
MNVSTPTAYVTAECIGCGLEKRIGPGEVPKDEVPWCPRCYSPMIAKSASAAPPKKARAKKAGAA